MAPQNGYKRCLCMECDNIIGQKQRIQCTSCEGWCHRECSLPRMLRSDFEALQKSWRCKSCCPNSSEFFLASSVLPLGPISYNLKMQSDPKPLVPLCYPSDIDFNKIKGLKFGHLNINYLHNSIHELALFLSSFMFHVFTLNETRLPEHYNHSEYEIFDYTFLPFDRKPFDTGGGSCFYIRNDCFFQSITFNTIFPSFVEINVIKLSIPRFKTVLVVNVYKQPKINTTDFLTPFESFLVEISLLSLPIIILGDFNIDLSISSPDAFLLKGLISQFNLTQLIKTPTRVKDTTVGVSSTNIDHIFADQYFGNNSSGTFNFTGSDHKALYVIKHTKALKFPSRVIDVVSYSEINWHKFRADLNDVDWSILEMPTCPNDMWEFFEREVLRVFDMHARRIKRRVKGRHAPWMSGEILDLIGQRNSLKKKCDAARNKEDTRWADYRKLKNKVVLKVNYAKRSYFLQLCYNAKTSKQIWSVYQKLCNIQKKPAEPIKMLMVDDREVTDQSEIAEIIAKEIIVHGEDESVKIESFNANIIVDDLKDYVSTDEFISGFKSIKPSVSQKEEISYKVFENTIETLAYPLLLILTACIAVGKLPTSFNTAIITPLYKGKGSRSNGLNYRGISILPIVSKIFEKIMFRKLYREIEANGILSNNQHGFRRNRSCFTAASLFHHDVISMLDRPRMKCGALFVDLRKAFDSIRPYKLLLILALLKIDARILKYLCAYFSSRRYRIKFPKFLSKFYNLFRGCPQGGILSPLLFSIYINKIGECLLNAFYKLFADDLVIYVFNENVDCLIDELTKILESLNSWCDGMDLAINFEKTKFMILHKANNKLYGPINAVKCNNHIIERVEEFKYLGVIFDHTLSFVPHFWHVCSKISSAAGCLNRIKRFIDVRALTVLINSLVYSHIDYCFPIWGKLSDYHLNILQSKVNSILGSYFYPRICNKFQRRNRIAHYYSNQPFKLPSIDYPSLWQKCNLLSIRERLQQSCAIFTFKAIKFNHIPEITDKFEFIPRSTKRNMRLPKHDCSFFGKSVFYRCTLIWNSLHISAKEITLSLPKFKLLVDQWLLKKRAKLLGSDC
jgi:hypothetical protein